MTESYSATKTVSVFGLIADREALRLIGPLNDVDTLALIGCLAEDPATWNDVALVWARYVYHPENTQFADSLPMQETSIGRAIIDLQAGLAWFAADLVEKRVLTGSHFPRLRLRGTPINRDEDGPPETTIVLPPWWELQQSADAVEIRQRRSTPVTIPEPNRHVVWGSAMTDFFAARMLEIVRRGSEWIGEDWEGRPSGRHEHTLTVHRDWLMTIRRDLNGKTPRDCIHGGSEWISDLADGQRFRVEKGNEPVPVSTDLSTFENAAFGRHEMVMYFDACRESISLGWQWLIEQRNRLNDPELNHEFAAVMFDMLKEWLASPFEGGPTAEAIIHADRSRVPMSSTGSHVIDCDCPICDMMASGMFGPSFCTYDGYMLEMDDDFAFSMFDTLEEWEENQRQHAEMHARINADIAQRREQHISEDDDFQSAWKTTYVADSEIPGDRSGHLSTAFFVAELVSTLKQEGADQEDVDLLNTAFRTYRSADSPESAQLAADAFKMTLNELAKRHETLVSRTADLLSRIDERSRIPISKDDDFDGVPF